MYSLIRKNPLYGKHARNLMKTDVKESKTGFEMDVDLPGFKKEDIQAKLEDGYLTISATKNMDREEKEKKTGRYLCRERFTGSVSRCFYVGEDLTQEDIRATYKHGILKLQIPKKEPMEKENRKMITIHD